MKNYYKLSLALFASGEIIIFISVLIPSFFFITHRTSLLIRVTFNSRYR